MEVCLKRSHCKVSGEARFLLCLERKSVRQKKESKTTEEKDDDRVVLSSLISSSSSLRFINGVDAKIRGEAMRESPLIPRRIGHAVCIVLPLVCSSSCLSTRTKKKKRKKFSSFRLFSSLLFDPLSLNAVMG